MNGIVVNVRMAEMMIVTDDGSLKTVLGSCVGVILRDPIKRISGLAHIMLPLKRRDDEAIGKYASSAIPALLDRLESSGATPSALQAFLVGGGQIFPMGNASIATIGLQNVQAARGLLEERGIPIVYEDTGGTAGRSVVFSNATGEVCVRTLRSLAAQGESR